MCVCVWGGGGGFEGGERRWEIYRDTYIGSVVEKKA